MSRYCGSTETKAILDAAEAWKQTALVGNRSVFAEGPLWNDDNLNSLYRDFVEKPDVGEGVFLEKLRKQLAPSSPDAKKLAAEMMWLLYLCPSSITVKHKREVIRTVWSWSGSALPETNWTSDAVLAGIGSGGPGFNQYQWRELVFLITQQSLI